MEPKKTIVAATKIEPEKLAKARDGLIFLGYPPEQLDSISAILKVTFIYGLSKLSVLIDIYSPPSNEAMSIVVKPKKVKKPKNW